ncbi:MULTISPECIES: PspA/IM30 family protein [Pseudomonadota]|jgi:phage shock protein A|uniref:PspA/IM30 family protein n=1 Tax=Pseudomonadota TaxID=1224 RepID=UPI000C0A66BD|nr:MULTISPECIES: PspA/IM30 family protein [Pseudomonadota]MAF02771.1 phage shock protein A [Herbaspirillum sp.]MBN58152.1 phage shock protein A [Oceanospirillaceae bacterium]|tara:strand:- start:763 stop:1446 length:684 start_codon:yes stop_codon:yes gene_type:complete
MSILKKIFTAVRGGAREVGEAIVDANAIRILEQEITDARNSLGKARENLTEVMAKEMQTKREISTLSQKITEHEDYASQAMEKGDEALAIEIAQKIVELEGEKSSKEAILESFTQHITTLKAQINQAEGTIAENDRQLLMVKTTESVQKATMSVTDSMSSNNSSMSNARESLERIKKRQQERSDKAAASAVLQAEAGNDLAAKIKAAGLSDSSSSSAESVLERIRAK